MTREILLPTGKRAALVRALKLSYPTVRAALRFASDTETAKRVRHVAIKEYGGVIVERQ